jgi:hypothetical protein
MYLSLMLPNTSDEQLQIIKKILNSNLKINAVAGSGKTTTNLHIAKSYKTSKILLLTYNSKLKTETRIKVEKFNIDNLETHSYHSFCVKYYDRQCFTDFTIKHILNTKQPKLSDFSYDIIIIDEAQDITPLFYELICKILSDNLIDNPRLVISGDYNQSIYDFNKGDNRYLKYADKLFINDYWNEASLSQSFRITSEIANFINNCMYNYTYIKSYKDSYIKPKYIICDTFGLKHGTSSCVLDEFKNILSLGYKPEEIFILAPSIRTANSPVRLLANSISSMGLPIYVPTSDAENIDESIIENKLVVSTIHQSKGRERKVVLLFGFDDSYFKYFKKDADPYKCPNELYVATTRAIERLIIFHHYTNDYLPFLNINELKSNTELFIKSKLFLKDNENKNSKLSVTDLIRHLNTDVIENCISFLKINNLRPPSTKIKIPVKTSQLVGNESVSEITGTAIPAYYEYKLKNKMTIFEGIPITFIKKNNNNVCKIMNDNDDDNHIQNNNHVEIEKINLKQISESELLYLSNRWLSYCTGYIFKLNQINNYNWLSKANLDLCINRMDTLTLSKNTIFEKKLSVQKDILFHNKDISGFIDCYDPSQNHIYEFKCTERIEYEHILQLAIYIYLYRVNNGNVKIFNTVLDLFNQYHNFKNDPRFFIYNILTDELIEIIIEQNDLKDMIKYLVDSKYASIIKKKDNEFIEEMIKIKSKYLF